MAVNIPGAIAVVIFYIAILVTGIIAGRKTNKSKSNESVMVADRGLGMFVSIFTICATMVGGGFLNGSAESIAKSGVLHTQAPIGYALGFGLAGVFFGYKMRCEEYVTMFDPFQLKYGKRAGALLFIPHFFGDLFWSAAVLAALGATISIILDIDAKLSVAISSAVAIIYTCLGGLYAVAYTDVIQLVLIFVGLTIAFPFALASDAVDLSKITDNWAGEVPTKTIGAYFDTWMLVFGGGIPWQALYQRTLACKTPKIALWSSVWGSLMSLVMVTPAIMFGIAGKAADWNQTSYDGELPLADDMYNFILPLGLSYLCPLPVGIIGIGAIAAAVMSSADSCILSTSTIFTKNIYNDILRPNASEREMFWVIRITIVIVGIMGALVAMFSSSTYGLFILCGDLMYVILFPQLVLVMYVDFSNAYGSVTGFFISLFLRMIVGEPLINFPAAVHFPFYDEEAGVQNFPVRTFAMLAGAFSVVLVSLLTNHLFLTGKIPAGYDILDCRSKKTIYRKDKNVNKLEKDTNIQQENRLCNIPQMKLSGEWTPSGGTTETNIDHTTSTFKSIEKSNDDTVNTNGVSNNDVLIEKF